MRYFLTGATGFIGGQLARLLRNAGHEVHALVRDPGRAQSLRRIGVRLHKGDITDRGSLREPMRGMDGVFHLAGWYKLGQRDSRPGQAINVEGTRKVLEVMRELEIPKGVYTSSLAVFSDTHGQLVDESYRHEGPWLTEYDRTKWEAHYEVADPMIQAGLPLVIVQPGVVYGPGDTSSIRQVLIQFLQRKLPMTPQQTTFCWGHVEDTAEAHLLAMDKGSPGESYIIAGPPHSLIEAIRLASDITGIPGPKMHPGPGLVRAMATMMNPIGKLVSLPETYTSESLRVSAGVTYLGNNEKARRELGFEPRPLREGLTETLLHEMQLLGMPLPAIPG